MIQTSRPTIVSRAAQLPDIEKIVDLVLYTAKQRTSSSLFMPTTHKAIKKEIEQAITSGSLFVSTASDDPLGCLSSFLDTNRNTADSTLCLPDEPALATIVGKGLLDLFLETHPAYSATFFVPAENTLVGKVVGAYGFVTNNRELLLSIDRNKFVPSGIDVLAPASAAAVNSVVDLHDRIFPNEYISGANIRDNPASDRTVFAVNGDDEAVAYGVLRDKSVTRKTVEVIAVAPEHRRKGLARRILESMLVHAYQDPEVMTIDLIVDAENSAALHLYRAVGFTTESENISYVIPPHEEFRHGADEEGK